MKPTSWKSLRLLRRQMSSKTSATTMLTLLWPLRITWPILCNRHIDLQRWQSIMFYIRVGQELVTLFFHWWFCPLTEKDSLQGLGFFNQPNYCRLISNHHVDSALTIVHHMTDIVQRTYRFTTMTIDYVLHTCIVGQELVTLFFYWWFCPLAEKRHITRLGIFQSTKLPSTASYGCK